MTDCTVIKAIGVAIAREDADCDFEPYAMPCAEHCECHGIALRVFSALAAAGYVIVPREPTEEMIAAGVDVILGELGGAEIGGNFSPADLAQEVFGAMRVAGD